MGLALTHVYPTCLFGGSGGEITIAAELLRSLKVLEA
jgi:hypothetical protein